MKINNSKIVFAQSANILINLNTEKGYYSKLNLDLKCTYCYMSRVLEKFKNAELITVERKGRNRSVKITEKGKIIADNLRKIVRLIR